MKVHELIQRLEAFSPESTVLVDNTHTDEYLDIVGDLYRNDEEGRVYIQVVTL